MGVGLRGYSWVYSSRALGTPGSVLFHCSPKELWVVVHWSSQQLYDIELVERLARGHPVSLTAEERQKTSLFCLRVGWRIWGQHPHTRATIDFISTYFNCISLKLKHTLITFTVASVSSETVKCRSNISIVSSLQNVWRRPTSSLQRKSSRVLRRTGKLSPSCSHKVSQALCLHFWASRCGKANIGIGRGRQ